MKRSILVLAVALLLASCEKLKDLVDINFSVPHTETVTVDGLPDDPVVPPVVGLRASIPPIAVATMSEENIKKNNTSSKLVTEVKLGQLKLDIQQPGSQTFDIADSLWLYMSADGLPEILAAHYFDIPKGIRSLDMNTSDENLKDYFLKDTVYIKMEGRFYQAPDSGSIFSISTRFDVLANPLNNE